MKTSNIKSSIYSLWILLTLFYGFSLNAQSVTDIEGKVYKTVKIGKKVWMAENLTVSRFRNGDSIPQARTPEQWMMAGQAGHPAWCYYDNNDSIGCIYGKLYNWYALTDPRGLAPEGWHMPSNEDWTATTKFLGGVDIAGMKMKSVTGWSKSSWSNNKSGFTAFAGGTRDETGKFSDINKTGQWWSVSKTIRFPNLVYTLKLQEAYVEVFYETKDKSAGLSVRAVQN